MSLEVSCPQCGHTHGINASMAGRTVRCSQCDATIEVPEGDDAIPAEAVAVEAVAVDAEPVEAVAVEAAAAVPVAQPSVTPPTPHPDAVLFHDVEEEELLKRKKRVEDELDMTSMVDVTFLLLIFFMVTASFSLQKSIRVPRQTSDLPSLNQVDEPVDELDSVELEIDEFGGFYVIAPEFEEETPGKQNLVRTLRRAIGEATAGMALKIKVHEMARLQALVDGMDAGTIAGFKELEVTQVENL